MAETLVTGSNDRKAAHRWAALPRAIPSDGGLRHVAALHLTAIESPRANLKLNTAGIQQTLRPSRDSQREAGMFRFMREMNSDQGYFLPLSFFRIDATKSLIAAVTFSTVVLLLGLQYVDSWIIPLHKIMTISERIGLRVSDSSGIP